MPRTRPLTKVQQKEESDKRQRERVIRIIGAACAACGYDRHLLSEKANIDYQTFNRRMRGELDFRLIEICGIANALNLDVATRAALCGAKEKCRYEAGYRA